MFRTEEAAVSAEQHSTVRAEGGEHPFVTTHGSARFRELYRRLTRFVFPMSAAFLVWYLLYVLMSAYARDAMATRLFGNVNLALVFGVLQFVTTFGIAIGYSRYAQRRLDPLADELRGEQAEQAAEGGRP